MLSSGSPQRWVPALLLGAAFAVACKSHEERAPLQVAAAADLTVAFEDLGQLFAERTGQRVTFAFGASGALAQQVGQGAPFDLFAAAGPEFVASAVRSGACDAGSQARYARGSLVAWTKNPAGQLRGLADLAAPTIHRVALANPEHAPYGRAAREALIASGVWAALDGKLVYAENVRQALQFAESGNADVALVARSLISARELGRAFAIDTSLHHPIEQTLVVCRRGQNPRAAREFALLVGSTDGQAVLRRYGFLPSSEPGIQ